MIKKMLRMMMVLGLSAGISQAATFYVDASCPDDSGNAQSWSTAKQTIQAAVDLASDGDTVWVTNGVYDTGGAVTPGYSCENRVVITNDIILRSVNGAEVTFIQGSEATGGGNGSDAVRGVYMSAGLLSGFTVTNGHTQTSGDSYYDSYGGGVNMQGGGVISNCTLTGNSASSGGGSRSGTLNNCTLTGNSANSTGGGSSSGTLNNCTLTGNSARFGGGSYDGTLNNCTLTGNSADYGGGSSYGTLNNCIVYHNTAENDAPNWSGGTFSYSCTFPMPSGTGNITNDPGLVSSSHVAFNSPCVGAGSSSYSSGTDIDGDVWQSPPSMGCDEPCSPLTGALQVSISASESNALVGHPLSFFANIVGEVASNRWDFGDGASLPNQVFDVHHAWSSPGDYSVVLTAYNDDYPSGISVTQEVTVSSVVDAFIYVSASTGDDSQDGKSWENAKQTLQAGVDAQMLVGATVWVTNGVYDVGGGGTPGYSCDNRVVITKDIILRSVNGAEVTFIQGSEATGGGNGSDAVRGVYMSAGTLSGFTITNGHTMTSGLWEYDQCGGGINAFEGIGVISNCTLSGNSSDGSGGGSAFGTLNNCMLSDNSADGAGGGIYRGTLNNCTLSDNSAQYGGGSYESTLNNCALSDNSATPGSGGGSYGGTLNNCTLTGNSASYSSGGSYGGTRNNCIIYGNTPTDGNEYGNTCWTNDPLFVDATSGNYRLQANSPCVNEGDNTLVVGTTDLEGNHRIISTAVDIGAYEHQAPVHVAILTLEQTVSSEVSAIALSGTCSEQVVGTLVWINVASGATGASPATTNWTISAVGLDFGDNLITVTGTNAQGFANSDSVIIARNTTHNGNSPTHYVSLDGGNVWPYTSWATAATNIQDAVDTAVAQDTVLVTNGIYNTGTTVTPGYACLNRLVITKDLAVQSVNGPENTSIVGAEATGGGNGSDAVRGVYMSAGTLSGFTITNGHTMDSGDDFYDRSGGGINAFGGTGVISNCTLSENSADDGGGGSYVCVLNNCTLLGNSADYGGGSIYGTLNNCTLTGNSADYGGGSFLDTLNHCTLSENSADDGGGGSYGGTLNYCTLSGNSAHFDGGGSAGSTLNNCTLSDNSASDDGGGSASGTLNNCTLSGNSASDDGGGSYDSTLNNCTLSGNSASDDGGGIFRSTLNNCIIYGNSASTNENVSDSTLNTCWIDDPLFVDAANGNLRLQASSPCVNEGDNALVVGTTDLDGNPRILYGTVDIGAYEFSGDYYLSASVSSVSESIPMGSSPSDGAFDVWNAGNSNLTYSISDNVPWLSCSPDTGSSAGEYDTITVSYDTASLAVGSYTGQITVASAEASNSPLDVEVVVDIYELVLDHFEWSAIGSPQTMNSSINVTISAKDVDGYPVSSFSGTAELSGMAGGSGQTEIGVGSGTAGWNYPMSTYYHDARTQVIYLDSEIGGSCSITSLALNVISAPGQSMEDWTIRMRHTTLDSYSGSPEWESDWVVVHQSTTAVSSTGWMTFGFDTPFEYNGTNNLMVDLSFNNTSYSSDGSCESTDTGVPRSLYYQTDSVDGDPLDWTGSSSPSPGTSSYIPNITLGVLAGEPVPISPTNTGAFVSGVWSGTVAVLEAASSMTLRADDGLGHSGDSNPFDVEASSASPDTDGDGLPDAWENRFGGDLDPTAFCSNGVNTVREAYIAGLDPTNATSRLILNPVSGNALHWSAISGRVYSIWWTTNLLENFQALETNLLWPQGAYTNPNPSPCDYYKIKVELE